MLCPVRLVSCDLRDGQQAAIATRNPHDDGGNASRSEAA